MKVKDALSKAVRELTASGVPDPVPEAEFLLSHALRCKRHELYTNPERALAPHEASTATDYIGRRSKREPAQYIVGETEFRGLTFKVTRATLIPRPETELVVDEALRCALSLSKKGLKVIDLCTGSGCIAVAIAKEIPDCSVYATDISAAALDIARENASKNNVADRVKFFQGDLLAPLLDLGRADLIVSNPPYVREDDRDTLEPEVKDFEPPSALFAGPDGLDFYKRIIRDSPGFITRGGFLVLELGWGQAKKVEKMAIVDGRYSDVEVKKDYSGIERILKARLT